MPLQHRPTPPAAPKLTNSQRALQGRDVPRNANDGDRLREEFRIKAEKWAELKDLADRLEEGRPMLKDEIILAMIGEGKPASQAERLARVSQQYKDYVKRLFDTKRAANDAWNAMRLAEMEWKDLHRKDWNNRAEMFMARG